MAKAERELPKLSKALRDHAASRGLLLSDIAGKLGLPAETLRNYLFRNAYPVNLIDRILEAFEFKKERSDFLFEIGRPYRPHELTFRSTETDSLSRCFHDISTTTRKLDRLLEQFHEELIRCFQVMRDQDLFAFTSDDDLPLEFRDRKDKRLKESVAQAIGRGVFCLYLFPTRKHQTNRSKFVTQTLSSRTQHSKFEEGFRRFQQDSQHLLMDQFSMSWKVSGSHVNERLIMVEVDECVFWQSSQSWGYFQGKNVNDQRLESRLSARLPFNLGIMFINDMTLMVEFRIFLYEALQKAVEGQQLAERTAKPLLKLLKEYSK